MSGDGDGWVQCAAGHRHWGRFGAAGLLISDGDRAILQHRAPWTHEGDTWGLPGGARDSHEDPVTTALREASEEAALPAALIEPQATWIDDHGGWSYTTVLARPTGLLYPHAANAESVDIRWWPTAAIDTLPLHHGLAATWPSLRNPPARLTVVIDATVERQRDAGIGGSPDGLIGDAALDRLARDGIRALDLPDGIDGGPAARVLPAVIVIGPGSAAPGTTVVEGGSWWHRAVRRIPSDSDVQAVVIALEIDPEAGQVMVVAGDPTPRTSGLDARVAVVDFSWLAALA